MTPKYDMPTPAMVAGKMRELASLIEQGAAVPVEIEFGMEDPMVIFSDGTSLWSHFFRITWRAA